MSKPPESTRVIYIFGGRQEQLFQGMFKSDLNHVNSSPTVSEAMNKCQLQVLSLAAMNLSGMVQLAVALPEAVCCSTAFCCSICWKTASSVSPPCPLDIAEFAV